MQALAVDRPERPRRRSEDRRHGLTVNREKLELLRGILAFPTADRARVDGAAEDESLDDLDDQDPWERRANQKQYRDWLQAQTVEDSDVPLQSQIVIDALSIEAERKKVRRYDLIEKKYADDIAALLHLGLLTEADIPKPRRRRVKPKDSLQ